MVTSDQLTLTMTNGNHGVNRLDAGYHGLVDRMTGWDTRRPPNLEECTTTLGRVDETLSINEVSESVNDTSEQLWVN